MIEEVRKQVFRLLDKDHSGHGMEHVERVLQMSLKFAEMENANKEIVALIALLHDVDDYKLFGIESANNLTNAINILEQCSIENSKCHSNDWLQQKTKRHSSNNTRRHDSIRR